MGYMAVAVSRRQLSCCFALSDFSSRFFQCFEQMLVVITATTFSDLAFDSYDLPFYGGKAIGVFFVHLGGSH
jgi:hypothetical protein